MTVNAVIDQEDRPPMVKFERRSVEDKAASREAGMVVYKDEDYVMIIPPYSKDMVEHKVQRWFDNVEQYVKNGRTPREWLEHWKNSYEHFKKGEAIPLNGTSVKNWPAITPAQCKTLIMANILTIEDLALVNDQGLRRLGMGAYDLKNKAKAYVQAVKDTGPLVMENAALKKQADQQETTIANLIEKMEIMGQRLESMQSQPFQEAPVSHSIGIIDSSDDRKLATAYASEPTIMPTIQEQYTAKFGKPPHHRMKPETILKKLAE